MILYVSMFIEKQVRHIFDEENQENLFRREQRLVLLAADAWFYQRHPTKSALKEIRHVNRIEST